MNTYNVDSSNNGNSNNIGIISVDQPSFGLIVYENKSSSKFLLRDNRVDEIDLQLHGDDESKDDIWFKNEYESWYWGQQIYISIAYIIFCLNVVNRLSAA